MNKGEQTKSAILDEAAELASLVGLGGLTIGTLAAATKLSKSGLYAHFDSKEALQVEVLRRARDRFGDVVLRPAIKAPRGEPRLRAFFDHWIAWQSEGYGGGCIFVNAASEFDDQEGAVRDELLRAERDKLESISLVVGTAITEGHFRPDVDPAQFAYELEGIILAHHHAKRLMRDDAAAERARRAFERLLADCRVVGAPALAPAVGALTSTPSSSAAAAAPTA
ncbi:TetR family transcriptional regulator [Intrasporangium oryzae NRRL B-24470]|uniref:TetR family transcriptional regulator n=1 Tax=Intrasporangium oryzae NRRL B-24470 TaxID=1386089 RepID=W9G472_9MICO|nr:TetR/AcrR family transcriptional regulator [Intrasporangium oryzae]EWT00820.1 TetR family transcriptional regulator [Intrasporangium oryzae NRRL B-24470]